MAQRVIRDEAGNIKGTEYVARADIIEKMKRHAAAGHKLIVALPEVFSPGEITRVFGAPFNVVRRSDAAEYKREGGDRAVVPEGPDYHFYEVKPAD